MDDVSIVVDSTLSMPTKASRRTCLEKVLVGISAAGVDYVI